jgi:hypothetical protein
MAPSSDLRGYLTMPTGTSCKTSENSTLYLVTFMALDEGETVPEPPAGSTGVIPYYEIEPDGAAFEPPITITFKYTDAEIPEGADENDLVIMWYDPAIKQWIALKTLVDVDNNTASAVIGHFSLYTMMLVPRPAAFELSGLSITPIEIGIDDEVTVSVLVTNTGDLYGDYDVVLTVNEEAVETRTVTLDAGESVEVTFTVLPHTAGTYDININGLSGVFIIIARSEPEATSETEPTPGPTSEPEITTENEPVVTTEPVSAGEIIPESAVAVRWWVYAASITAVVVLGLGVLLLLMKRKSLKVKIS